MADTLPIEAQRLKQLRKEFGYTQAEFAELLDIKTSTIDVERGKMKLSAQALILLQQQFNVNPLWLFGKSKDKFVQKEPKLISLNDAQEENIMMVNAKAAAGYPSNISNHVWYEQLPAFSIPLPQFRGKSIRGFQISGFSMLPFLKPDTWVLAEVLLHLNDIEKDKIYIVVTEDSVLAKRVEWDENNSLRLISDNADYPEIKLKADEVKEIWKYLAKIEF